MLEDLLAEIDIEAIHKRLANGPLHNIYMQMVEDVRKMREAAKDIPLCQKLLDDLNKPAINRTELKWVYAGMFCILNLLLEQENTTGGLPGGNACKLL